MSLLFEKLGIDTYTVIEAAKSKYNFQPHYPGPGVGGPCLPVNAYQYLNSSKKIDVNFLKIVQDAMFASTNEVRGTSYRSRIDDPKYQFAGKTGTAQVKRITEEERELDLKTNQIPYKQRDHAWYVAFGPYKDPRYAVSILVEHGGSGGTTAAPIAKKLFKFIIDRHELREEIRKKNLIQNTI